MIALLNRITLSFILAFCIVMGALFAAFVVCGVSTLIRRLLP